MKSRQWLTLVLMATAVVGIMAAGCNRGQQGSYPAKPIEYVVHSEPGSMTDMIGRTLTDVVLKQKLSPQPMAVVNKSGGSGAVAVQYMAEKKGDGYSFLATATSVIVAMSRGQINAKITDFTPISLLDTETIVMMVRADSPYNSLDQIIKEAKANPKKISEGFGSIGSADHILMFKIQKLTGAQFNLVNYKTGADVIAQALGGHLDIATTQPGEAKELIEAKKMKALAVFGENRIEMLKDVPTAKEQGLNVTSKLLRGLIGPPEMPKEAVSYLDELFKKATEATEWKEMVKSNGFEAAYQNAADWGKTLTQEGKELDVFVEEMGLKEKK